MSPPEIDPGLAAAAYSRWTTSCRCANTASAAADEPDALTRIADLLHVDEATISRVLDQPLRWILPQFRTELETIAADPTT
jgi:hypothetical protein